STGVGRYLSGLLDEWSSQDDQRRHEFVLYAHTSLNYGFDSRRLLFRTVPGDGGTVWEQIHLPIAVRHDHLDVLFAPAYTAPLAERHPDVSLDIVGDNRSYPHEDVQQAIASEGLNQRVRWQQYVSEDALHALYATSRAFAFLSEYEGLGLPPLEGLAAGLPAVLLDTPVARESCGNAA